MNINKLVFDTEAQGNQVLIDKGVWQQGTEEGVTSMQYINGTKAVVYIGKVVKNPATYDKDGHEITPPIYYDGVAFDVMTTDVVDIDKYKVFPNGTATHQFFGYKRGAED